MDFKRRINERKYLLKHSFCVIQKAADILVHHIHFLKSTGIYVNQGLFFLNMLHFGVSQQEGATKMLLLIVLSLRKC